MTQMGGKERDGGEKQKKKKKTEEKRNVYNGMMMSSEINGRQRVNSIRPVDGRREKTI